jgi:hypothetical protein
MSRDLGLKCILVKSHSSPKTVLRSNISSIATTINKKANIIIEVIIIYSLTSQHFATYRVVLDDWQLG